MGSQLISLLGSIAAKAGDELVAQLMQAWGVDNTRRVLERHILAIQDILLLADAHSRTDPALPHWMADFETAAYRIDAVLDGFRYEALRHRAAQNRRHATARKVLSYFTANSPVVLCLSMRKKMKDALGMMDGLAVGMNRTRFLQHAEAPTTVHPQTPYHVDESEIVGRQDEKDQVVKILLDHSQNNCNNNTVMVLPIVGMGGSGKTILAQLVHNDQRVVNHFDLVLWVCVSDKFVIQEIGRSILQVATMKKSDLTEMKALQQELGGVLGGKRYFLVLDDVWNEDRWKWIEMRLLLCSHAGSGSAIIVTSRSNRVASIMGTVPPHQISLLNEEDSWDLFNMNTFRREVERVNFISMARSIAHKCKGLPLAIKAIAAFLRSKTNNSAWSSVLDSDVWKDALTTTGIIHALQLSYDHLSSEAKICFSFCAIFPKDSPMDKDTLIQLWMANDFIVSETRGQQIFDVLVGRFFLQNVEIQKGLLTGLGDEFIHRSTTCKMHDLMHDLADVVSGNNCSILQESSSCQEILRGSTYASSLRHKVRHLSLDYASNDTIAAMNGILAPQPHTVLVFQRKSGNEFPLCMANSKFMSFRALKTFSIKTNMTNLKNIRYLDCSYSDISALPEATSILHRLQTLKLIGCRSLVKLPDGMRYMSNLRHVFLVRCDSLERMPEGIGQLSNLQTLTNYVIDSDAGHGIDQLKDLNLGGALSLTELRKVHSAENAKQGNMSAKHDLKQLSLDWINGHFYSTRVGYEVDADAEAILEALCPHKRLEVLLLSNYNGAKFSSWMHNFTLLEHVCELSLSHCQNCKDLPPLWQLPSLVFLRLEGLHNLTGICTGNDDTDNGESCISPPPSFPKLENMEVLGMPKLERWHQEVAGQLAVVSFPQLKKLNIFRYPVLASMPKLLPLLEDLRVKEAIAISLYHLMNLSVQSNLECEGDISVEPIVGWISLSLHLSRLVSSDVSLRLKGLTDNIERFEEELKRIPSRFIKELGIENCDRLFSSEPSQMQRNIWNHFGFVENMWIIGSNNIVQWPAVEFRNLNCLRGLQLSDCSNLTGSLPSTISDEKNALPPRLQDLRIALCSNLVELPELPASLEKLHISYCPKLVSMPTIVGGVKNLRELTMIECDALATFPDGMSGVTALTMLWVERCPRIETLPEGLLQQLPALEILCIRDCKKLEVAFSKGGAYWNLVEAIPQRSVRGSVALNA